MGLAGGLRQGHGRRGHGRQQCQFGSSAARAAGGGGQRRNRQAGAGAISPALSAQMSHAAPAPAGGSTGSPAAADRAAWAAAPQADFDSLIELITCTIKPTTLG